jgi:hypothetical protein
MVAAPVKCRKGLCCHWCVCTHSIGWTEKGWQLQMARQLDCRAIIQLYSAQGILGILDERTTPFGSVVAVNSFHPFMPFLRLQAE